MTMTKQQEEILRIMQEECGEVVQIVSKVCRFGLDERHIKTDKTNRAKLTEEIGDIACMIKLAVETGIITEDDLHVAIAAKEEKLKIWSTIYEQN
jgi:NTP pyrophosphatase (non-canonical NTP hydrolase)